MSVSAARAASPDLSALAAENAALRRIFDDTQLGMAVVDSDFHWVRVNRALCDLLGYAEAELIGRHVSEFTHPDDRSETLQRFRERLAGRAGHLHHETRYLTRTGAVRWVLVTASSSRDPVTTEYMEVVQVQDITVRKRVELALGESEARWRVLLAHLQEIVVLTDGHGRLTYATPSMERWLGYRPEELVGRRLSETSHPDDWPALDGAFERAGPGNPVSITHRVAHRDGSWHTLESTIVCLRDDPTVQGVLIASSDVSDRVALERDRERLDLERRVSHRLEAVGQLASGIAHEINTPLQFVGDSLSFLKDAADDLLILVGLYRDLLWTEPPIALADRRATMAEAEQTADLDYLCERIPAAFERTADGVARVQSIVQAMKRFSHASATEVAPADLNEAIETTLAVCRNEYKYVAEVELRLGELPPVPCNIGELNQVFLNLIINAAQAIEPVISERGRLGRITIESRVEDGCAVVEISDDGPGIPWHLQDRIYEPFFTTKELGKGTGQGLGLARAAVLRHHGTLECHSAPGAGASFTVRIPLEQPHPNPDVYAPRAVPGTEIA
jgi:PAS domain S-box-containing protein